MVSAGNKARHLPSVNHTIKTIHHHHQFTTIIIKSNIYIYTYIFLWEEGGGHSYKDIASFNHFHTDCGIGCGTSGT